MRYVNSSSVQLIILICFNINKFCNQFIDEIIFFFFKQKTAYEMRISDWSSDVCSSDLAVAQRGREQQRLALGAHRHAAQQEADVLDEAQVEHAVGLVQHAHLAGVQRDDLVLLDVVDQAAGRGDDDVDAFL